MLQPSTKSHFFAVASKNPSLTKVREHVSCCSAAVCRRARSASLFFHLFLTASQNSESSLAFEVSFSTDVNADLLALADRVFFMLIIDSRSI